MSQSSTINALFNTLMHTKWTMVICRWSVHLLNWLTDCKEKYDEGKNECILLYKCLWAKMKVIDSKEMAMEMSLKTKFRTGPSEIGSLLDRHAEEGTNSCTYVNEWVFIFPARYHPIFDGHHCPKYSSLRVLLPVAIYHHHFSPFTIPGFCPTEITSAIRWKMKKKCFTNRLF